MFSVSTLKTMLMKFAVSPEYRPLEEPKGGGANRRQQLEHKLRENWTCAARLGGEMGMHGRIVVQLLANSETAFQRSFCKPEGVQNLGPEEL